MKPNNFASILLFSTAVSAVSQEQYNYGSPGKQVGTVYPCLVNCTSSFEECNEVCGYNVNTVLSYDIGTKYQQFKGFGTSLAWFAYVQGNTSNPYRDQVADLIFNVETGLGLNVGRFLIEGGENPELDFVQFRDTIPSYEPLPREWNWNADPFQLWFAQAAVQRGAQYIEGFTNSPPFWMTLSNSSTGNFNGSLDNLNSSYFSDFIEYMVGATQHFATEWGIPLYALELFNEPASTWWVYGNDQEGCHFSLGQQEILIPMLHQQLEKSGLNTRIASSDDNSIDESVSTMESLESSGVLSQVSIMASHTYSGTERSTLLSLSKQYNKDLWASEYGDGDTTGLETAAEIILDLREMQPTVWCYWQAIDTSGSGWGPLEAELNTPGAFAFNVTSKYYVWRQFTSYLRPDSTFISIDNDNSLAAINSSGNLVIVTMNFGTNSIPLNGRKVVSAHLTVPWDGLYFEDVTDLYQGNELWFTLPVGGVISFEIQ
jgi:O-glycosyl hydrolase